MWIVRLALRRPYTFVVMSVLILVLGIVSILTMSTDIFPVIDIPVVTVIWSYSGTSPDEMEKRFTTVSERAMTTAVNDIEHIESQSVSGISIIKVFFQPGAKIDAAVAQVTAVNQTILRIMPPGTTPPFILQFSASNVPILQAVLSSDKLSESDLYDLGLNFVRTQLATVQGAQVPSPYGGKARHVMVDLDLGQLYSKGLSPSDVVQALTAQNLILPAGTAKVGTTDYIVRTNAQSARCWIELNNLPVKSSNGAVVYMRDVAHVHEGFCDPAEYRAGERTAGRAADDPEGGLRLDAGHCEAGEEAAAEDPGRAAAGAEDDAALRPIDLCAGGVAGRGEGGGDCGELDGVDDSAVPGKLAQHGDRRGIDSAFDPDVDDYV